MEVKPTTDFNPLPRKEGDVFLAIQRAINIIDFNPLPRKEGDSSNSSSVTVSTTISIHSLVKRETFDQLDDLTEQAISIHSLVKRETSWIDMIIL